MQGIQSTEQLGDFLSDEQRKIPDAHRDKICKYKKGKDTCRYIFLSPYGFSCVKKTPLKPTLDKYVSEEKMSAQGDNCEGLGKLVTSFMQNEENK
jgi:hypothetical protein